MYIQRHSIWGR